eukprot:PhF_6_TR4750/c0_g1_i1/m.6563
MTDALDQNDEETLNLASSELAGSIAKGHRTTTFLIRPTFMQQCVTPVTSILLTCGLYYDYFIRPRRRQSSKVIALCILGNVMVTIESLFRQNMVIFDRLQRTIVHEYRSAFGFYKQRQEHSFDSVVHVGLRRLKEKRGGRDVVRVKVGYADGSVIEFDTSHGLDMLEQFMVLKKHR